MLWTIIVFLLVLGLLIFVHELGHFVTAKRAGMKVEEFGFGFPPRIWGVKKGETIYSINWIPLGGFVKIYGEDGHDRTNPRSFGSKSVGRRAWVISAGVLMNFLLAAVLLSIGFWLGLPEMVGDNDTTAVNPQVMVLETQAGSPAAEAGLMMGDVIIKLAQDGEEIEITKAQQVIDFTDQHRGNEVLVTFQRGDQVLDKSILARDQIEAGEGPLGIAVARTAIISYPWYVSLYKGFVSTFQMTIAIIVAFAGIIWNLITTGQMAQEIAGPVGIFVFTGQAAKLGFIYVLQFAAIININIAIINILPLPALDGSRLIFLLVEKIKGSPINQKKEALIHNVGFIFIILLMIAITWRDVARHFF